MDYLSLDVETDFGVKEKKKLLQIGWCGSNPRDKGKSFWIKHEEEPFYPFNADPVYKDILYPWRVAVETNKTTPIQYVLADLLIESKNKTIIGWNIKNFDIPIIRRLFAEHFGIDWNPYIFDGYLFIKHLSSKDKCVFDELMDYNGATPSGKFPIMTAEAMFSFMTGCPSIKEEHLALPDAQMERHLISLMENYYGFSIDSESVPYI